MAEQNIANNPSQIEDQIAQGNKNAFIHPNDTGKLEIKQHYAKKLAMIAKNDLVVGQSFDAFNIKFDSNGMMTNPDLFDEAVNIVQQRFNQLEGASGQVPVNSVVDQTTNTVINRMANTQNQPLNQLSTPIVDFPNRGTEQFTEVLNTLSEKILDAQHVISDPELKSKFVQIRQELIEITDSYDKGIHNVVDRLPAWMAGVQNDLGGAHPDQVWEIRAVFDQLRNQAPAQESAQVSIQRNQDQQVEQGSDPSNSDKKVTTGPLNGRYSDIKELELSTGDFKSYREQVIAGERARGVNRAAQQGLIEDTEFRRHSTTNYKARATETYWGTVAAKQEIVGRAHLDKAKAEGVYAGAAGHADGISGVLKKSVSGARILARLLGEDELADDLGEIDKDNVKLDRQRNSINRTRNRFSNHGNRFRTESNFRMK